MVQKADPPKGGDNKRKFWGKSRESSQQTPRKRQETITAYAATTTVAPPPQGRYAGNAPKCNKCNYHHTGTCREMTCQNCNRKGHTARFCKVQVQAPNARTGAGNSRSCYECGETGHFKRDCPKLKNQGGGGNARLFALGTRDAIQDPSVVTGTFLINNLYATVLFDSGAERSFITPKFRQLLKHKSSRLKETYVVEMANGQTGSTQEILPNCTLTLNNHTFHVNLMPMTIGSFDVIIGMDWLDPHHADIMCHEKAVRLPLPNGETLIIYGDKSGKNLRIISCIRAQKYLHKKCYAFLAHVVDKRSKVKEIKDIPQVCDYPDVFPEDLPRLPPVRQVEF